MIGILLVLSIPITAILSNIVATWLEPVVKSRKRLIIFLFVLFSVVGGFSLYYFNVEEEVRAFINNYTTVATTINDEVIYREDTINVMQLSREIDSNDTTRTSIMSVQIDPQKLFAFQQPLGVKIIGWLMILLMPFLLILAYRNFTYAKRNYAVAAKYKYSFWEWLWGDKYGNVANNRKYNEIANKHKNIGWVFTICCMAMPVLLILTYNVFTPSLYIIETLKEYYLIAGHFFALMGQSIYKFFHDLLSPLFY